MNAQQRRVASAKYVGQVNRFQAAHQRKIYAIIHAQFVAIADIIETAGIQAGQNAVHRIADTPGMTEAISALHVQVGLYFTRAYSRAISLSAKKKIQKGLTLGINPKWTADIINFFRTELFRTVRRITETTRNQLLDTITKGIEQGWSIDRMVKEIKEPQIPAWRARLIARTEIAKATNASMNISQQDAEWETEKEWISAQDHRVRHAHVTADGQVVDNGAKFSVGGEYMDGPGDPTARLDNICNCRCTAAVTAKRDENGRLIPKKAGIVVIDPGKFTRPNQTIITLPKPAASVIRPGNFTRPGQTVITIPPRTGTND